MLPARICGMAMHMDTNVIRNTGTVAGLEAAIVTENGREEACRTTCLVTHLPSEILTTSSSLRQVLCSLPDILADVARAQSLDRLSIAQTRIGMQMITLLRSTVEIPAHVALEPVLETSTTPMLGTQRATSQHPHNAMPMITFS